MYRNENILNEHIDNIVNQVITEYKCRENSINTIVEDTFRNHLEVLSETKKKKKKKKSGKKKTKKTNKEREVLTWLNEPEVNTAEIRRKLEGEPESQEEEDSKRSYFMKKVHGKYGKKFTPKEINSLYSIKTGLG